MLTTNSTVIQLPAAGGDAIEKAKRLKCPVHAYVIEYGGYAVGSIRRACRDV
jgi:hypothetical protein